MRSHSGHSIHNAARVYRQTRENFWCHQFPELNKKFIEISDIRDSIQSMTKELTDKDWRATTKMLVEEFLDQPQHQYLRPLLCSRIDLIHKDIETLKDQRLASVEKLSRKTLSLYYLVEDPMTMVQLVLKSPSIEDFFTSHLLVARRAAVVSGILQQRYKSEEVLRDLSALEKPICFSNILQQHVTDILSGPQLSSFIETLVASLSLSANLSLNITLSSEDENDVFALERRLSRLDLVSH